MSDEKPRVESYSEAEYGGVPVNHPSIVRACKNMAKDGATVEQVMRVVGMPREVVEKHMRNA